MNRLCHRLILSRRSGQLVAVAEHARAAGKAGGGETSSAGKAGGGEQSSAGPTRPRHGAPLAAALLAASLASPAPAQTAAARPAVVFASKLPAPTVNANLPVPYGTTKVLDADGHLVARNATPRAFAYDPAKGSAPANDLKLAGRVSWELSDDGKTRTFNQGSVERVVLNWDEFNIGAGYKVHFTQDKDPAKYVSALNRIWSADPSLILGSLTADREVILLNANGVYFGRGAVVDTGKFVATALNIADSVFDKGLRNITDGSAVFTTASSGSDGYAATQLADTTLKRSAAISVEAGAEIRSAAGGDVLLIAPRVLNQGRIDTPGGQAVLAAGDKVYLMSSSDPAQRGLIVAVDPIKTNGSNDTTLGIAENRADGSTDGLVNKVNEIHADSGSVNLVGLTVRQNGHINATTAVKGANGAIYLQAMAGTTAPLVAGQAGQTGSAAVRGVTIEAGAKVRLAAELGTVEIGADSVTAVRPDSSSRTQLDAEVFNPSRIRVEGQAISVGAGAQITAPAGRIELLSGPSATSALFDSTAPLGSAGSSRIVIAPTASISAAGLTTEQVDGQTVNAVEIDGQRNQGTQKLFRIELADSPVQRSGPLYRQQVYFDLRDGSKVQLANVSGAAAAVGRTAKEKSTTGGTVRIESEGAVVLGERAAVDVSGGFVHYGKAILQGSLVERNGQVMAFTSAAAGARLDSLLAQTQRIESPAYTEGQAGGTLSLSGRQMALDGRLLGSVTQGERQRDGTSASATPATLALGRSVGTSAYIASVRLDAGASAPVDAELFNNALLAPLDALPGSVGLALPQVQAGGFGRLTVRANTLTQPEFGRLDLGVGGVLDVQTGLDASLNGRFSAAGGRLSVQSGQALSLAPATMLDVAGRWVNDTVGGGGGAAAPVQLNGGSVTLAAGTTLTVAPGATLDASAGAWLNGAGTLKRGSAGSLGLSAFTLAAAEGSAAPLDGVNLRALDFSTGGTLTLGVQDLTIAPAGSTVAAGHVGLSPDFFSAHGFGTITANVNGDITVRSGTQLAPRLLNWQLAEGYRQQPTGALRDGAANAQALDPALTDVAPVHLTLNANRQLDRDSGGIGGGASLRVERGADILLAPRGNLTLAATRNLSVGAEGGTAGQTSTLSAPGGSLTLAINGVRGDDGRSGDSTGFLGDQALWLGEGARLSVAGTTLLREGGTLLYDTGAVTGEPTALSDRLSGAVLGGGSIALTAQRGYVVAAAGAQLNLDGRSAEVNLPGASAPVRLSRAAGSLTVSSPEGIALDAAVSAQAPRDAAGVALADGGRLSLALAEAGNKTGTLGTPYPDGLAALPRTISIGRYAGVLGERGTVFGQDLLTTLGNGIAYLDSGLLTSAGFGKLALSAGNAIRFDTSLDLTLPLGLQLSAPVLAAAPGSQVSLRSAYAQIGDSYTSRDASARPAAAADTSADHSTRLTITAPTIDVDGNWALQGFSAVRLDAAANSPGEIRLTPATVGPAAGALAFTGRLELAAGQTYATSAGQYTLNGTPAANAADAGSTLVLRTGRGGAAALPPLSAFGALVANATQIDQGGVLRQPFGQITLNAERTLTLGEGSLTSVSGQGAVVTLGTTTNLTDWTIVGASQANTLPRSKGIRLSAPSVQTAPSATVSASGGGTVQASEFFPGVGGTQDIFDTAGLYAVLPDHRSTQALALDGGIVVDSAQRGREIIITTAGSGLAPGRYTLLPARYALQGDQLPQGAYLVKRAADQGKAVLAQALPQDDGSTIVSAVLTEAGSINTGTPGERFVVMPQATFLAKSEQRLTDISTLLTNRATTLGTAAPALPRDAGTVQVTVTGAARSTWQAALDLQPNGGKAGTLDLSATRLALVDNAAKTPDQALGVRADVLAASGAGSVLLGGTRSTTAGSQGAPATSTIDAAATQSVAVDLGSSPLKLEELLLAASGAITLAPGSQLAAAASGTLGARTLAVQGDGALLAVSANPLTVSRTQTSRLAGDLTVGAGSTLTGPQVALDASVALAISPAARLAAQALDLGAQRLVLGSAQVPAAGPTQAEQDAATDAARRTSTLDGELLAAVQATPTLRLRAADRIDFAGSQRWAQRPATTGADGLPAATQVGRSLTLDAPLLRGVAGADGMAAQTDIAAQAITLTNSSGRAAVTADLAGGSGSLLLQALPPLRYGQTGGLTLAPGASGSTLGFAAADLRSGGDIVLQGTGTLAAQGDLRLGAARLTAANAAAQTLSAAGTLQVAPEAGSRTLGEVAGLGAALTLKAATVRQDGVIDLPAGQLSVQASGTTADAAAVRFGAGSLTSVAGVSLADAAGQPLDVRAGSLAVRADTGRIELLGTLDASAALRADGHRGRGDGGQLSLSATGAGGALVLGDPATGAGRLQARGGSGSADLGGQLSVDVAALPSTLADANALADAVTSGGINRSVALRVRTGDLALQRGLTAQRISLSADSGALTLGAITLDARAAAGGVVQLTAGTDLMLTDGSRIDARSTRAGANGGDVLLGSSGNANAAGSAGRITVANGAEVDARGDDAADGRIVLRALRNGSGVNVDALNTRHLQAGEVDIEAVRRYSTVTVGGVTRDITAIAANNSALAGSGNNRTGTLGQAQVRSDNNSFMAGQASVLSALGIGSDEADRVHLRAGVEVAASGNLSISSDWALNATTERPGGDAGFLTLRAAGALLVNGSLSDGFSNATAAGVLNDNARSWSFRLAAGADLAAANPLAVKDFSAAADTAGSQALVAGNLTVAGGKFVRTGAGSIELSAGRDIVFAAGTGSAAAGQAYVAGRKADDQATLLTTLFGGQGAKPGFTAQGGRLALAAQRDITAPEATQLVNNWLWRSGSPAQDGLSYAGSSQGAWWTEFSRFGQTLGSFGGGNLNVSAGRDISNLQAMVPTQGVADSTLLAEASVQVRNGGDLTVQAGRDVLGGQYLVGRGNGRLSAEGDIGAATTNARAKDPLLALMDGRWDVAARGDATVGAAFNPTAVPPSATDNRSATSPYFYTWDGRAALSLQGAGGQVQLLNEVATGALLSGYGLYTGSLNAPANLFQVLPATLQLSAPGGDLALFNSGLANAILFPSATGSLQVQAAGNVALGSRLTMSDADPSAWPSLTRPVAFSSYSDFNGTSGLLSAALSGNLASASLHAGDAEPVRLSAGGSITTSESLPSTLRLPKAAELTAGQDILGLQLFGQNLLASDVTRITAGRNLLGDVLGNLSLAGPGTLAVTAGRQLDLQTSSGITTTGNLSNAALPAQGAAVRLTAAAAGTLDLAALQAQYLQPSAADGSGSPRAAAYRALLLATVRAALQQPALGYDEAWALFQTFPAAVQARLGQQVLASEFQAVYLAGSTPTPAQFTAELQASFERLRAQAIAATEQALAAGQVLRLPGLAANATVDVAMAALPASVVAGLTAGVTIATPASDPRYQEALRRYASSLRALRFADIDTDSQVKQRLATLDAIRTGWRDATAARLGSSAATLDQLLRDQPQDPRALAYAAALADTGSADFLRYRDQALRSELSSAGAAGAAFSAAALPMRNSFYEQGLRAAELSGLGGGIAQPVWQSPTPLMAYTGALNMTQSSVVTQRGGDISLVDPGGAITVGLKDNSASGNANSAKGVIALGGGSIFGLAKGDFQVNTQRVFVVGQGDMTLFTVNGDIDSGRGANSAVAAPPLAARRSVDGVVFETPATTTGSGLGILEDASGRRSGTIGLYPAFGEILALDAFIRAPSVVLGSTIKGGDNLLAGSVGGASAPVNPPALAITPPASQENRTADNAAGAGGQNQDARPRNALLTVDLLGLGPEDAEEACSEQDRKANKCPPPKPKPCSDADKAKGLCK